MFAPAYMGRNTWAQPYDALFSSTKARRTNQATPFFLPK
jgi:hypothetical protein